MFEKESFLSYFKRNKAVQWCAGWLILMSWSCPKFNLWEFMISYLPKNQPQIVKISPWGVCHKVCAGAVCVTGSAPGQVHDDPSPSGDPGSAGYMVVGAPRAPLGTAFWSSQRLLWYSMYFSSISAFILACMILVSSWFDDLTKTCVSFTEVWVTGTEDTEIGYLCGGMV